MRKAGVSTGLSKWIPSGLSVKKAIRIGCTSKKPEVEKPRPVNVIVNGINVTALRKQIKNSPPNEILRKGDTWEFGSRRIYSVSVDISTFTNNGVSTEIVTFQSGGLVIQEDRTAYFSPQGCKVINDVITEGYIEVYYPKGSTSLIKTDGKFLDN